MNAIQDDTQGGRGRQELTERIDEIETAREDLDDALDVLLKELQDGKQTEVELARNRAICEGRQLAQLLRNLP